MVLQAVMVDLQLLLSLPLTPFTYHVVLAKADGNAAKSNAKSSVLLIVSLRFRKFLPRASADNSVAHSGVVGEAWEVDVPVCHACDIEQKQQAPLPGPIGSAMSTVFFLQP